MSGPARALFVVCAVLATALAACAPKSGPTTCDLAPPPTSGSCPGGPTQTGEAPEERVLDSGVTVQANLTYRQVDGGVALQGDLYVPPGATDAGVVVLIHGGAWSDCGRRRDAVADVAEETALQAGAAVFNIEYRLTQEGGGYPNDVRDAYCALEWMGAHAADYQLNGQRMALLGDSTGGQLALNAALEIHRADLDPGCGPLPPISTVVTYSAPTDLPALAASTSAFAGPVADYAGTCEAAVPHCDVGKACDRCVDASPSAHACVSGDATQFLLVHAPAGFDPFVPVSQAQGMAQAFGLAGVAGQLVLPTDAQLDAAGCPKNDPTHPAHGLLNGCLFQATQQVVIPALKTAVGG